MPYYETSKEDRSNMMIMKGSIERMSKNYSIQGLAGSMTKTAAIIAYNEFENYGIKETAFIVHFVHDELIAECEEKDKELVKRIIEESMVKAGKVFCSKVPMTTETFIDKKWLK